MGLSITLVIIAITSLISYQAFNNRNLMQKLIHNPYKVKHQREYHRLLTSGFIHANFTHLLFNMLTLFFFGPMVEKILMQIYGPVTGGVFFVVFYLIAIIISDISSVIKYGDSPGFNSLGASGAVSAVLFYSILFDPLRELLLYFILPIPGFILGALYLVYSYWEGRRMAGNINHNAHLYGAIAGIAFAIISYPGVLVRFVQQIGTYSPF
ncbi:MAG: rhomboid family intramembrane serine protease [Cyclobacteriaceae bacterium]